MEKNNLWEVALNVKNNKKILDKFLKSNLQKKVDFYFKRYYK